MRAASRRPSKLLAMALMMNRSTCPFGSSAAPPARRQLRPVLHRQLLQQPRPLPLMIVDDHDPAAGPVQIGARRADHAHAPARGLAPAELVHHRLQPGEAADARHQHEFVDGLGQELVGPGVQPLDAVVPAVQRGDQHHGDVTGGVVVLEPAADLEAAHAGHHHVQQDDVGLFGRGHG
jgi:hypothetical protein